MTHFLVKLLSKPFIYLGFAYQFCSGSFYAGRILSTHWIMSRADAKVKDAAAAARGPGSSPNVINFAEPRQSVKTKSKAH
jgi:hypothetical protein